MELYNCKYSIQCFEREKTLKGKGNLSNLVCGTQVRTLQADLKPTPHKHILSYVVLFKYGNTPPPQPASRVLPLFSKRACHVSLSYFFQ